MAVQHTIRAKDGGIVDVTLNRNRAIKAMCTECMGYSEANPRDCPAKLCPLWPFRGKIQLAYAKGGYRRLSNR
jgi:hypothetical protein